VPIGDTPEGERFLTSKGLFPTIIAACEAAAGACDGYADKISETKREIIEKAAEFAVETVVFASLTVISFGSSDAAWARYSVRPARRGSSRSARLARA
jgi:hypothetical protein